MRTTNGLRGRMPDPGRPAADRPTDRSVPPSNCGPSTVEYPSGSADRKSSASAAGPRRGWPAGRRRRALDPARCCPEHADEADEVLEDSRNGAAQPVGVDGLGVDAVPADDPGLRRQSPARSLASVVFPDPFSPTRATTSPALTRSDTSRSAGSALVGYVDGHRLDVQPMKASRRCVFLADLQLRQQGDEREVVVHVPRGLRKRPGGISSRREPLPHQRSRPDRDARRRQRDAAAENQPGTRSRASQGRRRCRGSPIRRVPQLLSCDGANLVIRSSVQKCPGSARPAVGEGFSFVEHGHRVDPQRVPTKELEDEEYAMAARPETAGHDPVGWLHAQLESASPLRSILQNLAVDQCGGGRDPAAPRMGTCSERANCRNGYRGHRGGDPEAARWQLLPGLAAVPYRAGTGADHGGGDVDPLGRRVERLVETLGITRLSKSQVSNAAPPAHRGARRFAVSRGAGWWLGCGGDWCVPVDPDPSMVP